MKKKQKQFELISVGAKELRMGDKVLLGDNSLGTITGITGPYLNAYFFVFDHLSTKQAQSEPNERWQKAIYRK